MVVVDSNALVQKEKGTSFDEKSYAEAQFADGTESFTYGRADDQDFNAMFDQYPKSRTLEQVLTLPIRQAPYSIQRGQSPEEVHARVSKMLLGPANMGGMTTPMNLIVAQMTGAFTWRKAFFEKVWVADSEGVRYDKIAWRPAHTCTILRDKKNAGFQGFMQDPIGYENGDKPNMFKPHHSFVYIHGLHRNPLNGVSDMTIPYWCFRTSQKIRFLWYQFLEGQSLPKTLVHNRDKAQANADARKVASLRQGGIIGLSSESTVTAYESSGKGAAEFKAALQWLDSEASNSVLAGFTDLGAMAAGGTGSFALSKDQTDFFLMSSQSKSREMQDCINNFLIPDLVYWNFGPGVIAPTFEFGPIAQDDASTAISLLQATAQSPTSMIPREFFDELIERVAGFLELDTQVVRAGLERAKVEAEAKARAMALAPQQVEVAGVAGQVAEATRMVTADTPGRQA